MTDPLRTERTKTLVRYLAGLGFHNIRSRGLPHRPPPFIDGTGHPVQPDVTSHAGASLDLFFVVDANDLDTSEQAERVRYAGEAAGHHGARLWIVVPVGERKRVEGRLDALGVEARLLQV